MMKSEAREVFRRFLVLTVWVLGWTLTAPAAQSQEDAATSFGDVIDVELINVEVWVRDGKGRPITGLTLEDFELYEDGKPVEISHFTELRSSRPAQEGVAPLPAIAEEAAAETGDSSDSPSPSGRGGVGVREGEGHLVVYFDEYHLSPLSRGPILKDLRKLIANSGVAAERVMILRQSDDLTTEATFGATPEQLDAALERLGEGSSLSLQDEKRRAVTRLHEMWGQGQSRSVQRTRSGSDSACLGFVRKAKTEVQLYSAGARNRNMITLNHLNTVARILAGVPGVKTLLYVADLLETDPGKDLQAYVNYVCPLSDRETRTYVETEEMNAEFQRFTRYANANRLTFYTLQATGLRPNSMFGADQLPAAVAFPGFDTQKRSAERDGFVFLAQQTGGRAIFNKNSFDKELAQISEDMGTYYWLAYSPPHGGDGFEHKINVKVKDVEPFAMTAKDKKKLVVRHRRGYRDKDADTRMAERVQSALYLGEGTNPLAARLGSGTVRPGERGRFTLPLHVMVPVDKVVFLPQARGEMAHVKLHIASRNAKSGKVDVQEKLFRAERPTPGDTRLLDLVLDMDLKAGVHVLAVGVRDEATRETSYLSTAVEIAR